MLDTLLQAPLRSHRDRADAHATVAGVRRLDEEGRLLHPLLGHLSGETRRGLTMDPEEEVGDLLNGEGIVQKIGVS